MKKMINKIKIKKDQDGNFVMNKAGITLIALVITIVVLIILASIAVGYALGHNGLLNRTKEAKENYLVAVNDEQIELANAGQIESSRDASSSNPIGTVISLIGNSAPQGYLVCDNTEYNIADYSALANYFDEQFGSINHFGGDGTTTFKVPDLRGEFLRGTGENGHSQTVGSKSITIREGDGANVGVHQASTSIAPPYWSAAGRGGFYTNYASKSFRHLYANADRTASDRVAFFETGSGATAQTGVASITLRPTNTSVLYCIKY